MPLVLVDVTILLTIGFLTLSPFTILGAISFLAFITPPAVRAAPLGTVLARSCSSPRHL